MADDPFALAREGGEALARRLDRTALDAVVVLGTGLLSVADLLGAGPAVPVADLPGFVAFGGPGHRSGAALAQVGGRAVLLYLGRSHLYEGREPAAVVHPVRAALAAGCDTVVLTSAVGGIRPGLDPGDVVVVSDHLNLTGRSPLAGLAPNHPAGSPFVDLSGTWSPRLAARARAAGPDLPEGVYAQMAGPQFETPAEIAMLARLGADVVGMSTVPEAIAARHLGAQVLGLAVVTNPAGGTAPGPVDLEALAQAAGRAVPVVARAVSAALAPGPGSGRD